jgi:CheY-like chemotaxis protein
MSETLRQPKPCILCVDDEPEVLAGLKMTLRGSYTVLCASGAIAAFHVMEKTNDIAVVISDMRMPEVNGATFLSRLRLKWPDTTRILLTGESGQGPAIAAVNEGQIFRFLTKPCAAPDLLEAVNAAYRQYQLVTHEKTLLQQTLVGSINALVDLLGILSPAAFGRAGRVKRLSMELNKQLGNPPSWELEAAALLSQIGYATLPPPVIDKLYEGKRLTLVEAEQASGAPLVGCKLLSRIPRLERVASIIEMATVIDAAATVVPDQLAGLAAVLSMVLKVDLMVNAGDSPTVALEKMRIDENPRNAPLLEALSVVVGERRQARIIREIRLGEVTLGMILLTDVRLDNGALMISRDYEVSHSFMQRLHNFSPSLLTKIVQVSVPRPQTV